MVFKKVKIFAAALALCFSANISHAQTPGLAGLLIQFNQLSGSLPAIPGLDPLLGTVAAANSQLLQAIIPLSNNVPVLGTVVGGVVPIVTQLTAVALPILLNPPSDQSGIQALLTTDLTSLLDLSSLLPGASTDFLVLPALPIIPDLVEL